MNAKTLTLIAACLLLVGAAPLASATAEPVHATAKVTCEDVLGDQTCDGIRCLLFGEECGAVSRAHA